MLLSRNCFGGSEERVPFCGCRIFDSHLTERSLYADLKLTNVLYMKRHCWSCHVKNADTTRMNINEDGGGTYAWQIFFFYLSTAPVGLGLLYEVSRSHSDTPHTAGLFWTSDLPIAKTSS